MLMAARVKAQEWHIVVLSRLIRFTKIAVLTDYDSYHESMRMQEDLDLE